MALVHRLDAYDQQAPLNNEDSCGEELDTILTRRWKFDWHLGPMPVS
jgi:hypothetical protein